MVSKLMICLALASWVQQCRADSRETDIIDELKRLSNHTWAGTYRTSHRYGGTRLALAPRSGFIAREHGCLGLYTLAFGAVTTRDAHVVLKPDVAEGTSGRPREYQPVVWGRRHYLIEVRSLPEFCAIADDGFDRHNAVMAARFFLREGDEKEEPGGRPHAPAGAPACPPPRAARSS